MQGYCVCPPRVGNLRPGTSSHLSFRFKGNNSDGPCGRCTLQNTTCRSGAPFLQVIRPGTVTVNTSTERQRLRKKRRSLSAAEREAHSESLYWRVSRHPLFINSQRIATYLPVDGEIDPRPLVELACSLGKKIYLPVLIPFQANQLWFARWTPETSMAINRFGIAEPQRIHRQRIKPQALDLVLAPLVGFDKNGNRLGMGGGFYDRTFEFLLHRNCWRKPRLLGMAFDFQKLPQLPAHAWDVPLTAVATGTHVYSFKDSR